MNIVLTGASRGIGFATAIEFSKNPEHHIIAISRNEEGLRLLKEHSKKSGNNNIQVYKMDITNFDKEAFLEIIKPHKSINVLINNAGQLINKSFANTSITEWRNLFDANFFSAVEMINILLPFLKNSGTSHIVNVGSMGGIQGTSKFNGLSAYSASKAALANLTECLAEELKEHKVFVNCLAPGSVSTEMFKEAFPKFEAPVSSEQMGKFIAHFSLNAHHVMNGKIIPLSINTP